MLVCGACGMCASVQKSRQNFSIVTGWSKSHLKSCTASSDSLNWLSGFVYIWLCSGCSDLHFWQPRSLQQSSTQLLHSPDIRAREILPCLEQENQNNNGVNVWTWIFFFLSYECFSPCTAAQWILPHRPGGVGLVDEVDHLWGEWAEMRAGSDKGECRQCVEEGQWTHPGEKTGKLVKFS